MLAIAERELALKLRAFLLLCDHDRRQPHHAVADQAFAGERAGKLPVANAGPHQLGCRLILFAGLCRPNRSLQGRRFSLEGDHQRGPIPLRRHRPAAPQVELRLRRHLKPLSCHPGLQHLGWCCQQVAVGDNETCQLVRLDRAEVIRHPQQRRRRGRHGRERRISSQPTRHRPPHAGQEATGVVEPMAGERDRHARLRQTGGILGRHLPVQQVVEIDAEGGFGRGHIWRLGEIDRQDDDAIAGRDRLEPFVFVARSTDRHVERKLTGKPVGPQHKELVGGIADEEPLPGHMLGHCRQGVVALGLRQRGVGCRSLPGPLIPVGIEKRLTGKRHSAHRRTRVVGAATARRHRQPQVLGHVAAHDCRAGVLIVGEHNRAPAFENPPRGGEQASGDSLASQLLVGGGITNAGIDDIQLRRHLLTPVGGALPHARRIDLHLSERIDQAGRDRLARQVPDPRVRRRLHVANGLNASVAHDERALLNHPARRHHDAAAHESMHLGGVFPQAFNRPRAGHRRVGGPSESHPAAADHENHPHSPQASRHA